MSGTRATPIETDGALAGLPSHFLFTPGCIREAILQPGVAPESIVRRHTTGNSYIPQAIREHRKPIKAEKGDYSPGKNSIQEFNQDIDPQYIQRGLELIYTVQEQEEQTRELSIKLLEEITEPSTIQDAYIEHIPCVFVGGHVLIPGLLNIQNGVITFHENPVDMGHRNVSNSSISGHGLDICIELCDIVECACVMSPPLDDLYFLNTSPNGRSGEPMVYVQLLLKTLDGMVLKSRHVIDEVECEEQVIETPIINLPRQDSVYTPENEKYSRKSSWSGWFSFQSWRSPKNDTPTENKLLPPKLFFGAPFRSLTYNAKGDASKNTFKLASKNVRLFVLFAFAKREHAQAVTRLILTEMDAKKYIPKLSSSTYVPCSSNATVDAWAEALDISGVLLSLGKGYVKELVNAGNGSSPKITVSPTNKLSLSISGSKDSWVTPPGQLEMKKPKISSNSIFTPEFQIPPGAAKLLTSHIASQIVLYMPIMQSVKRWKLAFCTKLHGISFQTFYRHVSHQDGCVLLLQDSQDILFGAYLNEIHLNNKYYGNAETFVFTFKGANGIQAQSKPTIHVYQWSTQNEYFIYTDSRTIAVGGGGHYAITIDSDFFRGSTDWCSTFSNPPLASTPDFIIQNFQVWILCD